MEEKKQMIFIMLCWILLLSFVSAMQGAFLLKKIHNIREQPTAQEIINSMTFKEKVTYLNMQYGLELKTVK